MAKQKIIKNNDTEFTPNEILEVDSINEDVEDVIEEKFQEDYCKVIWIKQHSFGIDFQGYGISIHVAENHIIDREKINDLIRVRYKSNIGLPDFELFPIYE